jgi:hypothetical protein
MQSKKVLSLHVQRLKEDAAKVEGIQRDYLARLKAGLIAGTVWITIDAFGNIEIGRLGLFESCVGTERALARFVTSMATPQTKQ